MRRQASFAGTTAGPDDATLIRPQGPTRIARWIDRIATWAICLALVLIGGCRTGEATGHPSSAKAAAAGLKIAGIGFQDDQFFKLVEAGMKSEAQKLGVSFSPESSASSIETEGSLVDADVARQVSAIAIAPLSAKASVPALQRAHEAGIKIVTFDSPLDADFPESSIKSDPLALGSATGEAARRYIQTKLNGKAKLAIITYMALAPEPASQRTKGFEDEMKKLPGVEIVATQDAWLADRAVTTVETILTGHPEVNVIWAANEGGTVGAVTAVKNTGRAGKVVVFGTDISEQMADFLLNDDNILQAVTGQKPFEIGSMAVEAAVKALKGEKVEKKVSLSGILFTRERPDEVRKYKEYLHGLIR